MEEIWKEIGTNGKYLISNYGRIKSVFKYSGKRNDRKRGERIMIRKPLRDKDGYIFYHINIDNTKKKTLRIHKEVVRYFINSDFSSNDQICHKDGNIENNHVSNLYIGNQKMNTLDKYLLGHTKISINDIKEMRKLKGKMMQQDMARKYNISQSYVSEILSHKCCIYV